MPPKRTTLHPQHTTPTTSRRKPVFTPETSALLIIDMQSFFCCPSSHAYFKDATTIIPRIQRLRNAYRDASRPIVFTRYALLRTQTPGAMGRWWNDVLYDDDHHSRLIDALQPDPQDHVIRKTQYSAFFGTDLDKILKTLNVTSLLISGVLTHLCCETTARDAFMRNYDVFFVKDATASDEKKLHAASIRTLADGCATIVTTKEVLSWINDTK